MLSVIMLNVVMLSVIMFNVVMLSVMAPLLAYFQPIYLAVEKTTILPPWLSTFLYQGRY